MNSDVLVLAARLVNPLDEKPEEVPEGELAEKLVRLLERNKYSLIALKRKLGDDLDGTPIASKVALEESLLRRLREEFERVRLRFSNDQIETILIKASYISPSFPYLSSNLDVLVRSKRGDDARRLLHELGYIELLNVEEPSKFLFRKFAGDGFSYTLHLHEKIGWGVPFVDEKIVFNNARAAQDDVELLIPSPEDVLLITLAHWFYEDKELSLWNLFSTASVLAMLSNPLDRIAGRAEGMGWEDGFFAALRIFNKCWREFARSDYLNNEQMNLVKSSTERSAFVKSLILRRTIYFDEVPAKIPFLANKVVYYRKLSVDPSRSRGARVRDWAKTLLWAVRWKLHIRSQKPLLIAFSGCDGSGKTVQAGKLKYAMETCDIRSRIIWTRGGSSKFIAFFIKPARKLLRQDHYREVSSRQNEETRVNQRRIILKNPVWRFLYGFIFSIDLAWAYVLKARFRLLTGETVICDRYAGDAIVDFAVFSSGDRFKLPFSLRALEFFSPRPDVCFLLDVEEREALRRKPEEGGMKHLSLARRLFEDLAESRGWRVVPAGLPEDRVYEVIALETLREFYKKYGTFLNRLLLSNPEQVNPGRWRPEPKR